MASAANLLRRATDLLPPADRLRVELLPDLAEAQFELGELDPMGDTIGRAAGEARQLGDEALAARAAIAGAVLPLYAPARAEAISDPALVVRATIGQLEAEGDHAGLARAWRVLAMVSARAGQYDAATSAVEQMIEHAVAADERRLVVRGAAGYASQAVYSSRPVSELVGRFEQLLEEVRGDRKAEGRIALELAQLHAMDGAFTRARELVRHGQALTWDLGPSLSAMTTSIQAARVEMLRGDLELAESELRRDNLSLEAIGETYYRSAIAATLARVVAERGDTDEAEAICALVETIADAEDADSQVLLRLARIRILLNRGDLDAALQVSAEAAAMAEDHSDPVLRADVLLERARVLAAMYGTSEAAELPLREALRLYAQKGDRVSEAKVNALLGTLTAPA